jgi:hypothetical protein
MGKPSVRHMEERTKQKALLMQYQHGLRLEQLNEKHRLKMLEHETIMTEKQAEREKERKLNRPQLFDSVTACVCLLALACVFAFGVMIVVNALTHSTATPL